MPKKVISKSAAKSSAPVKKTAPKTAAKISKQAAKPAAAKKATIAKQKEKKDDTVKVLELGLLLDCTSSMSSWIERAKSTLKDILKNVVDSCSGNLTVKVCFVGYRDHCDAQRFTIHEFTEDIEKIKKHISSVQALGGGDFPEDVVGGQRKCLDQKWSKNSSK